MMRRLRTSKTGLELIKSFEGFRARSVQLPDGRWTIGYSHTRTARENLRITPADADAVLREYDLPPVEAAVCNAVLAPLSQNEFDALVSFVFNIGEAAFLGSKTLAHLNAGEPLKAADAISLWRKARLNGQLSVVDALVRRRAVEQALFLKHPSGTPVAPSGFIRPLLDAPVSKFEAVPEKTARDQSVKSETVITRPEPDRLKSVSAQDDIPPFEVAAHMAAQTSRLTRELGVASAAPKSAGKARFEPAQGPTPDEITRAISALANPDNMPPLEFTTGKSAQTKPATKPAKPQLVPPPFDIAEEDLPPLPDIEFGNGGTGIGTASKSETDTPLTAMVIDDLEAVKVDPLLLEKAIIGANDDVHRGAFVTKPRGLLHSLIGLVGLGLGAFGAYRVAGQLHQSRLVENEISAYLGYGSLVLGIFLVLLAVFLVFRSGQRGI